MSTRYTISRVSVLDKGRDLSAPIIRPTIPINGIECMELENPDMTMLSKLRSANWEIKFQTFNTVWTPNGMRGHHYVYLEREPATVPGEYHQ